MDYKDIKFLEPTDLHHYLSISSVNGLIGKPFDQKAVAEKTYNAHYNDPASEYYHKTIEEICEDWSNRGATSCRYGSLLDDYIGLNLNEQYDEKEMFELDHDRDGDERLNGLCSAFDLFVTEILKTHPNLVFVTREQTVYYPIIINGEKYYIKGRFDALFYNKDNGHYIIVDWKSSKDIVFENKWEKLLGPLKDLDACNGHTYSNQVYFYKTALENGPYLPEGTIVDCMIVQFTWDHLLENGKHYCTYTPKFEYNKELMDKVYTFAIKKNNILNKK